MLFNINGELNVPICCMHNIRVKLYNINIIIGCATIKPVNLGIRGLILKSVES